MKKILILSVLILTGCLEETSFSLQKADYEYELDTWGKNSEIYEFTPKSNTDYSCVMFMLDSASDMAMDCIPKPKEK